MLFCVDLSQGYWYDYHIKQNSEVSNHAERTANQGINV